MEGEGGVGGVGVIDAGGMSGEPDFLHILLTESYIYIGGHSVASINSRTMPDEHLSTTAKTIRASGQLTFLATQ
jgi:hypothetical protein